jgi:hypothetical protein
MSASNDRDVFVARCLRVAAAARDQGVSLRKSDGSPGIEVSRGGASVTFPIVTDARTWRETTVEEAFYAALVDARAWAGAHLDEVTVTAISDDDEKAEVPLMRRDLDEERARTQQLTTILGGQTALDRLMAIADLT